MTLFFSKREEAGSALNTIPRPSQDIDYTWNCSHSIPSAHGGEGEGRAGGPSPPPHFPGVSGSGSLEGVRSDSSQSVIWRLTPPNQEGGGSGLPHTYLLTTLRIL